MHALPQRVSTRDFRHAHGGTGAAAKALCEPARHSASRCP